MGSFTVTTSCVIVAAAFITHFLTAGWSIAMGVYYVTFLEVFQQSHGVTAWIGSLNFATLCIMGPVASIIISRYGCSITIILGGFISASGMVMSSFATSIYTIFISHGIITGVGYGFCFAAGVVVINTHFEQRRALAMGFSISGVGVGACIYPFIYSALLSTFGWRGALLVSGGLTLHACLAGVVLWTIRGTKLKTLTLEIELDEQREPSLENDEQFTSLLEMDKLNNSMEDSTVIKNDYAFMGNLHYLLLHGNCILFCFGQSVVFTHMMAYGESESLSPNQSAALISAIGFANIGGRIVLGAISSVRHINLILLLLLCYCTAGVSIFMCTLWSHWTYLISLMLLFGFVTGAFGPVLTEVCCKTVGVDYFATAYGVLLISMGTGSLIGAPIAGALFDYTKIYANSLYLGAVAFIASSLIVLPSCQNIRRRKLTKDNTTLASDKIYSVD